MDIENFIGAVSSILLLDLVLSGDNALVIGAAASEAPRKLRKYAILLGGSAAIILRISLAYLATILLNVPWLQTMGSIVLLFIAIRLLQGRDANEQFSASTETAEEKEKQEKSFFNVILTVLLADITMSLDNILAVGALANGNFLVLAIGVLLSIILLLIGSTIISYLVERLRWLIDVAAIVLGWTSASMILTDLDASNMTERFPWLHILIPIITIGIVCIADAYFFIRKKRRLRKPDTIK